MMRLLFVLFVLLLGQLSQLSPIAAFSFASNSDNIKITEEYIIKCAKEKKIIVLDHDVKIKKDVVFFKIEGQGHAINVSEGVTIKTTDDSLSLKNVTFVINDYGNKNGFPQNRGRLIQSTARNVLLNNIIVKTGREGDSLKFDETSGWRGRGFILISHAERIDISNITSYNIGVLMTYDNSHNARVKNIIAYNCETNQYIKPTCSDFNLSDIEINNKIEDKYWVIGGMSGIGTNGKNVVLTGASNSCFKNISGKNCIERVIYSRGGGNIKAENLTAINCGGFKFVGNSTDETEWAKNVKIKNCKWIRTESELRRLEILKSNLSPGSLLTVAASNLDVFQINKIDGVEYNGAYVEDRTGENSSSISNVNSCRNVILSNWEIHNVRCSRPVVYLTGSMPEEANITIANMKLYNYVPSKRTSESILVGYRTTVPIEKRVSVICNNVSIINEGISSRDLFGKGISGQSMVGISIKEGLSDSKR